MNNFGFVIPLQEEAAPLLIFSNAKLEKKSPWLIYKGRVGSNTIAIIISGAGKIRSTAATQFLIDHYSSTVYVHYGTSGSLTKDVDIGDVVIADNIIEHDVVELFPQKVAPPIHAIQVKKLQTRMKKLTQTYVHVGSIISGDEDIVTTERKNELSSRHNALAVDWESAGFALTCTLNKAQHYVFRAISDGAHEDTKEEYSKNQVMAVKNVLKVIVDLFFIP